MILHIGNLEKFIPPFVEYINDEFESGEHFFYFYGDNRKYPMQKKQKNVVIESGTGRYTSILFHVRLIPLLLRAEKVIIHGLFNEYTIRLLAILPWVLNKCYWLIWGGDLYSFREPKLGMRNRIQEMVKAFVIKRFGYLVTYIPGDAELARQWYGARGEYRECLMYLSNVVDSKIFENIEVDDNVTTPIKILVGNSTDPSNNHFEALDKLAKFKDEDIQIFVPLSYGRYQAHAKAVIEYGSNLFGDKFIPITKFMKIDEYKQFLSSIDIAIFNHKRQQAMGNTITLLSLGKTVFLQPEVSQTQFFKSLGIKVFSVEQLELNRLLPEKASQNMAAVADTFSFGNLKDQWSRIFEG